MPSLPPASAPVAAPPSAQPASRQCVRWMYVDQARRHDVRVGLRGGGGEPLFLFVEERGDGAPEVFETVYPLQDLWESRVHHLALEERLCALGPYLRHSLGSGGGWVAIRRAPTSWTPTLAPLATPGLPPEAQVHFYGSADSSASTLLLALRLAGPQARFALARLDFEFPDAEKGRLRLVHANLGPTLLRSAVALQDQELQGLRLQKVTALDRKAPTNAEWCAQFDACIASMKARVSTGRFGGEAPRALPAPTAAPSPTAAPAPPAGPAHVPSAGAPPAVGVAAAGGVRQVAPRVITNYVDGRRLTAPPGWKLPDRLMTDENPYEVEYDPPDASHSPDESAEEAAKIEETTMDFRTALTHPRILALHREFLAPGEDDALLREGEMAIRSAIAAKRTKVPLGRQHLLSIVEASLLVRHSLGVPGRRLDPQASDLLRRALVYLS
ncbi:MAG TPA: hypothetical protein VFH78_03880 [Candidatus Thermoplasmatota archaeon]|nr:hypothetical protein [Candidatus Thermoplasmatota archaeon]